VGVAAAAGQEDARAAADAAAKAFPAWAASQPGTRREILLKAADLLSARAEQIAQLVSEETGGVFGWGMFNVSLASAMLREAAAQAYGLVGEVIPSDIPGKLAMGVRHACRRGAGDRAMDRARDPLHARAGHSAGVRQHRGAQGLRAVPAHTRGGGQRGHRRRAAAGRAEPDHQRSR
jgi:Aldehyde dehydrogenase family